MATCLLNQDKTNGLRRPPLSYSGGYQHGDSAKTAHEHERGRFGVSPVVDVSVKQGLDLGLGAGATLDPPWFEANEERQEAAAKMRSDKRMTAALQGEVLAD